MRYRNFERTLATALVCVMPLAPGVAAGLGKTLRVEHGRPVVVVTQNAVVVLEFLKEPARNVLVTHESPDWKHCQARYRYQLFDGATDQLTGGAGMVEEIYHVVSRSATGEQVEDMGSRTQITVGEFSLGWSRGTAGERSWLYYQAHSAIRFIQQPQRIAFDSVNHDLFRRYLASKNVEEFATAGQTVQVIGPAVFSGDLPDETSVSGRIESCRVRDGSFELALSNLATNRHYVIESSYELKTGNWNVVHTFTAREPDHRWSDPLAREIKAAFYRIREGL